MGKLFHINFSFSRRKCDISKCSKVLTEQIKIIEIFINISNLSIKSHNMILNSKKISRVGVKYTF